MSRPSFKALVLLASLSLAGASGAFAKDLPANSSAATADAYTEALEHFRKANYDACIAILRYSNSAREHYLLSSAYVQKQNFALAEKELSCAMRLEPGNEQYRQKYKDLLEMGSFCRVGFSDIVHRPSTADSALASYNDALKLQSEGKFAQAAQKYRSALSFCPRNSTVLFGLGTVYQNTRDWARAIECYKQSVWNGRDYQESALPLIKQCQDELAKETSGKKKTSD